ncbi:mannose-6-phosphate isomerase-like protein (cupin superfamily) [Microbacterium sp. SORGH_AS 969]|nr:mannose-6-phosphate isomerase-like protein (cupin superfamily) [Microbacterium sp. SORGH_AS_0969]
MTRDRHPPRSPWRVRRIPLEGREVGEWFRLRGWTVEQSDAATAHAFIDEAVVADVAVRRVWHTALALSRSPRMPDETASGRDEPTDTLVVHVAGRGIIRVGDDPEAPLAPNDVLLVPRGTAVSYRSSEPIARIEIDHGARDRAADAFHANGELVSVAMITSAVNALFHAHDQQRGGGG